MKKNPSAAFLVLRLGLGFVFIWFAFAQFGSPAKWVSFLPSFLSSSTAFATSFILMNALFELVAGVLIILGAWTRLAGVLLALHLFGIAFTIGMTAVGVRDIGLAVATLALAIGGAGNFSIDAKAEALV